MLLPLLDLLIISAIVFFIVLVVGYIFYEMLHSRIEKKVSDVYHQNTILRGVLINNFPDLKLPYAVEQRLRELLQANYTKKATELLTHHYGFDNELAASFIDDRKRQWFPDQNDDDNEADG
jgi:hypothetical protein